MGKHKSRPYWNVVKAHWSKTTTESLDKVMTIRTAITDV